MVQQNNLREEYLTNGYIVIKSLFTKEYISNLREKMMVYHIKVMMFEFFKIKMYRSFIE